MLYCGENIADNDAYNKSSLRVDKIFPETNDQ